LQLAAQPPDFFSAHELAAGAANSIRLIIPKCEAWKLFGSKNSIGRRELNLSVSAIHIKSAANLFCGWLLAGRPNPAAKGQMQRRPNFS
jgi:hypothetical protein